MELFLLLFLLLGTMTMGEPPTPTPNDPDELDLIATTPKVVEEEEKLLKWSQMDSIYMLKPCNHSREVIQNSYWGRISDGPFNYTHDTTCEWLIKAPPGYWISLKIDRVRSECSYDYLFVVDGESYVHGKSKLLGSFSGASNPHVNILAQSGNMLILLYSDPNYVLEGFNAEYSISHCPLNCSNAGDCVHIQNQHVCKCAPLRGGVACEKTLTFGNASLISVEPDNNENDDERRVLLASSWNSPLARVGHSVIRLEDKLFVYGGFDLNLILDNLITLDLHNNHIKQLGNGSKVSNSNSNSWPSGRYAHASVLYANGFFIHGGKTRGGDISSELFYYNASTSAWTELPSINLPKLMYHTMTLTPSGEIYVFGGATGDNQFSSKLYRFNAKTAPQDWAVVQSPCCGKESQRRLLGHTMTFWPARNALILFGGVGSSDYGRFSKLSGHLWLFSLNSSTWVHLDYKRNGGVAQGVHPERSFHTAMVVDQYLTIFGGYTHVHNRDESCYSNQLLIYNLECQIFLPMIPSSANAEYKPSQGLFGHASVLFKDELWVIGGYRGYLNQGIKRIPFPYTKAKSSDCSSFDRWRCSGEPKCGWCPTNNKCFDKLSGASNCTTNLQTSGSCPGICNLLTDCQSCVIPGCIWCGSLEACWKESSDEMRSACNNPLDNTSQSSSVQCSEKSWRMGATQFEYRYPANFSNPDAVRVINASLLIISREYGSTLPADAPVTFGLRGSFVGLSFTHPIKKLELCSLQASVNLSLSSSEESFNASYKWTDYQLCYNLTWPSSGEPVYLMPSQRIAFDLRASSFGKGVNQEKSGRVTIQLKYYSGPISSPRVLKKDHLIPYEGYSSDLAHHHCLSYPSCLPCAGDLACVWRLDVFKCIPRSIPKPSIALKANPLSLSGEREYISNPMLSIIESSNKSLIIQPEDCPLCSDFNTCSDCLSNAFDLACEWWEDEMSCQRRGRHEAAIVLKEQCPSACNSRTSCSSCLDSLGKCVWCETAQECFVFSLYTSVYQYGQCYHWIDKVESCKRCDVQSSCESCILNIGCGWSSSDNSCSEGDFSGPYKVSEGNNTWTYASCPDINECELQLNDCHPNATCVNSPGSFTCICQPGFTGDGRSACDRTCEEECGHGSCNLDTFKCECELGWTAKEEGKACSVDCRCHNHSHCFSEGPGKCDECKDYTTGEYCEQCQPGTFGNATLAHVGCTPCNCNNHGDAEAGLCDPLTGHCFCLNNTSGRECGECGGPAFYGEPADGKPCYHGCSGRRLILGKAGYFGLPPELGPGSGSSSSFSRRRQQLGAHRNVSAFHVEHCMWIIKAGDQDYDGEDESREPVAGILITIEPGFAISCSHNVLLLYKGYSEFGVESVKGVPLIGAICNDKDDRPRKSTPTYLVVEGNVVSIVLKYARLGFAKFHFNGAFKALGERELESLLNTGAASHRQEHRARAGEASASASLPFNISSLYDGTSPSLSVLSRYGHSLHVDQKNLWIFGGYSLNFGPLNDIRHFSRESASWVPLTITILQNGEGVPPGRYFHAAVIIPTTQSIYIHGGISANLTFLSDSWKFDTRNSRWNKFCEGPNESPGKLAGHSLTLRPGPDSGTESFSVVLIGGFNPEEGFSDKVYSLGGHSECWVEVESSGSAPLGIYGHSTVYYGASDTFYVFGGTLHDSIGSSHVSTVTSSRLFVLHWPSKRWSVLSPSEEFQLGPYPNPRFLHTAVTTDEYMVVLGGIGGSLRSRNSTALVYIYKCNLWLLVGPQETWKRNNAINIKEKEAQDEEIAEASAELLLSELPDISRVAGAAAVWENEIFLMGGWEDGSTSESLFVLSTPTDPCFLQKSKSACKGTFGCAFCSSNNNRSQQCYNAESEMPSACSSGASNIEFYKGAPCSSSWLSSQGCERFASCSECLAMWPSHPNASAGCQWCTNGKEGSCRPLKNLPEDLPGSSCGAKQWVIVDSSQCPERSCSSPQCEGCISASSGKCIWTRHIQKSRERSWELRLQPVYDWNCIRKSILDTSPNAAISSSPPMSCPIPCAHFDSCVECLESPGAEGGYHQCYWAVGQGRCISPAYSPILCFGGICGPVLKGSPAICPKSCSTLRSCGACLQNPSCGWCAVTGENGEGGCLSAKKMAESSDICSASNGSEWHYSQCPREDECANGHSFECDAKSEQCIDEEEGYRCQCREGYERSDARCVPICPDGCVHGSCVEPGVCSCSFGYVGTNCSAQCDCNGHSNCEGVDKLDACIECHNNTMGPKCSQCLPMYVGDPRNNGQCIACLDYCNGHSPICLSHGDYNKWCNGSVNKYLSPSQLMSKILSSGNQVGPSTTAYCCHCSNQTEGDTCSDCKKGFFRGYDDKRLSCRKCECHGHGFMCDPITGHDCNCHNNTESEHCTQNTLKANPHYQCWRHQCSKCRESFLGTPTNGHQCYMQMQMEEFYCFDPKSLDQSCAIKQKPLLSGRTVYYGVQPKFMNVDIRVTIDVTHGSINVFLSPKDDTFVIRQDESRWIHKVEFDGKYGLNGDKKDAIFTTKTSSFSGESNNRIDPDYESLPPNNRSTEDVEESGINRIIPKPIGTAANSGFRFVEQEAAGYATYFTVQDPKVVLIVRNLRNRLVITLPQDSHDLRLTRFYLVLEGIGDVSFGAIQFRQDQLHIDLFVFFSVFFSAFFLFLSGCGVAWKVKQNMEARRARHRHVAEMLSMAKRPFAVWNLLLQPDPSSGISEAYTQCRKTCRKGCICLRPLALEWTSGTQSMAVCTMLISLPGGSAAPMRMCIGSVLANLQRSHIPYHARRRRLQH